MFDAVWDRIISGKYKKIPAQLFGYRRLGVVGEVYPGIIPGEGIVEGVVRLDVTRGDIEILDKFEAECYRRIDVVVNDNNHNGMLVSTYVIRESYKHILENSAWDVDRFKRYGLDKFLSGYRGFNT
jgi:gamma-glutamylcyclotransferase (GGCT)/AIG2-like uncharacterized protein YtfP